MDAHTIWHKEPGARLTGSRDLDSGKLQAPGIVSLPDGGFRLFYTAVGPAKPFPNCQGYILSAVSDDGLTFRKEPGIRVAPQPDMPHMSLRLLAPTLTRCSDGRWRMYFEARGPADHPTVICSAVSSDMLNWEHEDGIRLRSSQRLGGPRYLPLPGGGGRLYCFSQGFPVAQGGEQGVVSAFTEDGVHFEPDPGFRLCDRQNDYDSAGITAAEVIAPQSSADGWTMFFSAWQDVPPGTVVPTHPSSAPDAAASGVSADFAAASIAADMAGYRSRIFSAHSPDGLTWQTVGCAIEGAGYGQDGLDAVHAEDMSLVKIDQDRYRMYYAACDKDGNWCIASAVTGGSTARKQ